MTDQPEWDEIPTTGSPEITPGTRPDIEGGFAGWASEHLALLKGVLVVLAIATVVVVSQII